MHRKQRRRQCNSTHNAMFANNAGPLFTSQASTRYSDRIQTRRSRLMVGKFPRLCHPALLLLSMLLLSLRLMIDEFSSTSNG